MNTRTTWFLVLLAAALGVFSWLQERRPSIDLAHGTNAPVTWRQLDVAEVQGIELMRSNTVLRVERTNGTWRMRLPVDSAAQNPGIDRLLDALAKLTPRSHVSSQEMGAGSEAWRAYGLDESSATTLTLTTRSQPVILKLGAPAPMGSGFYFRRVGDDGVFIGDGAFLSALPVTVHSWRDRTLLDAAGLDFDRLAIRSRGTDLEAARLGSGDWQLVRPLSTRADAERFDALVRHLQDVRVAGFVTDQSAIDAESYGFQPAEAEVVLRRGTNDLARLQFGRVPTNAPGLIYVRRLPAGSVVVVPLAAVEPFRQPLDTFRDRRLLPLLDATASLEIQAPAERLALQRDGTNWWVTSPHRFPADTALVKFVLDTLSGLEVIEFVNDVATDWSRYGLERPRLDFTLRTNTVPGTNAPFARLAFGTNYGKFGERVYVRRGDEPVVYGLPTAELSRLPEAGAQLRDWHFAPTNVTRIEIRQKGRTRELTRGPGGWTVSGGKPGNLIEDSLQETLFRLGKLKSERYSARDEKPFLTTYKLPEVDHTVVLHFDATAGLRRCQLRLGGLLGNRQVALANFDDDPVAVQIFLPLDVGDAVLRDLSAP